MDKYKIQRSELSVELNATIDTLNELATALGDDPNFATTVATQIGTKVDKVTGKELSTNDYTTVEKTKLSGIATSANNYVHPDTTGNRHVPSGGIVGQFLRWDGDGNATWGADNNTTYSTATPSYTGLMENTDKSKLDSISWNANNYVHPTTSGNKHIPSAGVAGQFLKWSADGTAIWADNNTTYPVVTTLADGLMDNTDKVKLDGIATSANNYVHPTDVNTRHVTDTEKDTWNSKESTTGAQIKATTALNDAKTYADTGDATLSSAIGQNTEKIDITGWAVQGSEKLISNALFIGGVYNTGKWGCATGQTANLPVGFEVGIRETIAYDNNNVTIRLTENRPVKGRIWTNTYDSVDWSGWKEIPDKSYVDSAIGQLQTDMGNIDVSWDGITGKPTAMPANGGNADTVDGKHASDFLASVKGNGVQANDLGVATELRWKNFGQGHTIFDGSQGLSPNGVTVPKDNAQSPWGVSYPILMGWNGANTYGLKVDTARTSDYVQGRDLCTEVNDLKSSVVNGKQEVVNAINGSLGYASGLTTSHTHGDYAWWIQNKVAPSQALSFIPNFFKNFSSVEALNAAVPLGKGIEAFLSLGTIPQVKTITLSPMTGDIIFFNGNLSSSTYGKTLYGRMRGTQPFTIAFYWTDRYGNQVIETLYNTTFVERTFFYKFNAFYILNPLKGTITTDNMSLSTATGQSSVFSITI